MNGDDVLIRALASDIDGEITAVKFYNGTTLIGEKHLHHMKLPLVILHW